MTTGMNGGAPTGDSDVYSEPSYMTSLDQSAPPNASNPFAPTLQTVPEPSALCLLATGLAGMSVWMARRRVRT
jgi:hypothetical protein